MGEQQHENNGTWRALRAWVNSVEGVRSPIQTLGDLRDTRALYDVARAILPRGVDMWKAEADVGDNDPLREANLRKLLRAIKWWFSTEHDADMAAALDAVDVAAVVRRGDPANVVKVLEVLLAASVQCDEKASFIQNIMGLDPDDQHELMVLIDSVLRLSAAASSSSPSSTSRAAAGGGGANSDPAPSSSASASASASAGAGGGGEFSAAERAALLAELADARADSDHATGERQRLVARVSALESEVQRAEGVANDMREELEAARSASVLRSGESVRALVLESPLYRKALEDLYNANAEVQQSKTAIAGLNRRLEEAAKLAVELKKQRDEVDLMRERVAAGERALQTNEKLKMKLDELGDVRDANVQLSLENRDLTRRYAALELESVRTVNQLKERVAELELQAHLPRGAVPEAADGGADAGGPAAHSAPLGEGN